ncbi:hypothetical protein CEXT_694531 [Caerostris extrusa]|uniref:Uncharacterized protein n=1 Tax=Caerostris extrusa TaxID=172846 RepID=A0AAV4TW15_CAEEX|nr:hypothetical protein CEXT_694531 [Caerostris extrusa]
MYTRDSTNLHGSGILDLLAKRDKKINNCGPGLHSISTGLQSSHVFLGGEGGGVYFFFQRFCPQSPPGASPRPNC